MATTTTSSKVPMDRYRKIALAAGLLYLATFVTSIPALGLYDVALNDVGFLSGAGSSGSVRLGAFLEMFTGLTGIGTAIVLYPVVKRFDSTRAVGFVATRTLEAAMISVGIISMLALVTLRGDVAAGADAASLTASWSSLVAVHDWTFLLGPGFMATFNALCLAVVMRRSGLVPRIIPTIGLIGAPLLFLSSTVTMFGGWDQVSGPGMALALPIATWEFSLGVWMTFKGFKAVPSVTADDEVPAQYAIAGAA